MAKKKNVWPSSATVSLFADTGHESHDEKWIVNCVETPDTWGGDLYCGRTEYGDRVFLVDHGKACPGGWNRQIWATLAKSIRTRLFIQAYLTHHSHQLFEGWWDINMSKSEQASSELAHLNVDPQSSLIIRRKCDVETKPGAFSISKKEEKNGNSKIKVSSLQNRCEDSF